MMWYILGGILFVVFAHVKRQDEMLTQLESHNPEIQTYVDAHKTNAASYNNLPLLPTSFKERHTALDAELDGPGKFHYDRKAAAKSYLEKQYVTLTDETPLELGAFPGGRSKGMGTQLRDPGTADMLKPPRREQFQSDVFGPEPTARFGRQQGINDTQREHGRIHYQSKTFGATGAFNDHFMHEDSARHGFSTGVFHEPRGNRNSRVRIWRKDETRRGRNQFSFMPILNVSRPLNTMLSGIGEVRQAKNGDVNATHRPPLPTGGIKRGMGTWFDFVTIKHSNRDNGKFDNTGINKNTEQPYTGAAQFNTLGSGAAARRDLNLYVRPKKIPHLNPGNFLMPGTTGNPDPSYTEQDFTSDLHDRTTNRFVDDQPLDEQPDYY